MARPSTGTVQWFGDHWRARVTLADGSRPWLDLPPSIGRDDEAKAREKARELASYAREHGMQRADDGALVGTNETVREYAERWLTERERRGFRSVRDDRQRLNTHAFPVIGDARVRAVTARELRALVASLDAKTRAGALAATTARKAWGLVAKLFTDAQSSKVEALRVRDDNPASGVAPPDGGHARAKAYLYPSEFAALVGCEAIALRFRRLYALAVYTYCRAGELEALQVEDVDLEHGTVHVHRAIAHTGELRETKTGETRRVRLEPTLRPLLEVLTRGRAGDARVIALPSREDGAAMLRRHLRLAGVTRAELFTDDETRIPLTFHDLRATGITWRAVRGDDPLKIQRDAGHRDLATTQRYIREASVYGDGFGAVFPELPASLLTDGPGAPDGGGGEGGDRRRSRGRPRGSGARAEGVPSIESSNAPTVARESQATAARSESWPTSYLAVGLSPAVNGLETGPTGVSSPPVTSLSPLRSALVAALFSLAASACSNHPEQLARAESHFQSNRYQVALSNLEDLEIHRPTMSVGERVRYDVVRGMAHLRLNQPRHARYWLSLAREEAAGEPTALTQSMRDEIERVVVLTDPLAESAPANADGGAIADAAR